MSNLILLPGRRAAPTHAVSDSDLAEPWLELSAIAAEAEAFARVVTELARLAQKAAAAGRHALAAMYADRLERAATTQTGRAKRAQALARLSLAGLEGIECADAIAAPGHGRAA